MGVDVFDDLVWAGRETYILSGVHSDKMSGKF